jgi:hypothetical protein
MTLAGTGSPVGVAPAWRFDVAARDAVGLDRDQRAANSAGRLQLIPEGAPPSDTPVVRLTTLSPPAPRPRRACGRWRGGYSSPVVDRSRVIVGHLDG